jgi:hypothetical protein
MLAGGRHFALSPAAALSFMPLILPVRSATNIGVYLDENIFDKIVAKIETRSPRIPAR